MPLMPVLTYLSFSVWLWPQGVGYQDNFLPIPKVEEIPYEYMEVEVYTFGPEAPSSLEKLKSDG